MKNIIINMPPAHRPTAAKFRALIMSLGNGNVRDTFCCKSCVSEFSPMWRLGIFICLVASGSVFAEVPEPTFAEQMAAEKLARGLEMQRLETRLTNIEQMLEQIIQAKDAACAAQERRVAPPVSLPTLSPTYHRKHRHHHR